MYSRDERTKIKEKFWTSFGRYMQPVVSADGENINWINYRTGEKNLRFVMDADNKNAEIAIILSHPDKGIRELYFDQLKELKKILHATLGEEWNWTDNMEDDGRMVSKVYLSQTGVSIMKEDDWPTLISFFKPRIIALDEFWSSAKHAFELLR